MAFDNTQAFREGWGLFEQDNGETRVQRLDDPRSIAPHYPEESPFKDDTEALAFVRGEAIAHGGYHSTAFLLHGSRPNADGSTGRLAEPAPKVVIDYDEDIPERLRRRAIPVPPSMVAKANRHED